MEAEPPPPGADLSRRPAFSRCATAAPLLSSLDDPRCTAMRDDLEKTHGHTPLDGTPEPTGEESSPALVQLAGPGAVRRFLLERTTTRIGRAASNNEIVLEDRWVSRRHARIVLKPDGGARLEDRGSSHGSRVNSEPRRDADLVDGDLIQIGQATFKYLDSTGAEAPFYSEVFRLAFRDPVTGAYSRRYFDEALARESLRADRRVSTTAVLLIDLDHFKEVNDTLGHSEGDRVLAQAAGLMQAVLRGESITARFGGDEFAILLPATEVEEAASVAERLRQAVEAEAMGVEGREITISVGVAATEHDGGLTADRLLHAADVALYRAKRAGRNRVKRARPEDGQPAGDNSDVDS